MYRQKETVTLSEFVAEKLSHSLIEALDRTIIYIISDAEDMSVEEVEGYRVHLARSISYEQILIVKGCMLN